MEKIKVVFCMTRIITGGIEKCLLRIIEKLAKTDKYEFLVVIKEKIYEQYFIDFFEKYNIKVITINDWYKFNKFDFLKKWWQKYKRMLRKKEIQNIYKNSDIVIDYFNCMFLRDLKKNNTPKIGVYHSSINFFDEEFVGQKDLLFNTYDKFVCLTKSFKNDVIERFPQYKDKITYLYNPVDIDGIRKLADSGAYPKDEKYFVYLARFSPEKDHNCVIDAFKIFSDKVPDAKIYFLGAGDKEAEYKEKVRDLNLQDKIIFTGAIPNPYGYLKHAVANILASHNEGLSNVLIEAAALGVLNISSNCKSSAAEVLLDGEAGILFPVGDSSALSDIMYNVWTGSIDKTTYIETANAHLNRFNIDNIIPIFEKLIKETISQ